MTFTLCPECGNCLGEIITFVKYAKYGMIKALTEKEYKDYSVEKLELKKMDMDIGFILDLLGAKLICCRQHILGSKENELLVYV